MRKELAGNNSQMFCPQCGGQVELDSPDVKFCRFCGLSLTESRESVQGLTSVKQMGVKFSVWGFIILQILYLVVYLTLIPSPPVWVSVLLLIVFALSNGFFIVGNFAVNKPEKYARDDSKSFKKQGNRKYLEVPAESITEGTTRKLSKKIEQTLPK